MVENAYQEELFKEIQTKFYNISRILDCVSCEKCRLNGKVQIKGLGTAMKILFHPGSTIEKGGLDLKKTEIISLINLLYKLSESLNYYEEYQAYEVKRDFE